MPNLPEWVLAPLLTHLPRLEAEETERLALAAMIPHMTPYDRQYTLGRLQRLSRFEPRAPAIEIIEHNPDKAREWFRQFAQLGVEVIHSPQ